MFVNNRNLALEGLARRVKYPCKYRSYGCAETFSHDAIGGHQDICQYIPQKCPAAKLAFGNCSWTGSYRYMEKHLKENHLELCCEYVEGAFKFLYGMKSGLKFFCFIFAYNEVFFSVFEANNNTSSKAQQTEATSGFSFSSSPVHSIPCSIFGPVSSSPVHSIPCSDVLYSAVLYVGPAQNASKYKYKVEFVNKDDTAGITVMHLTSCYKSDLQGVYSSYKCGKLHTDQLNLLKDEKSNMKYKLEIMRVDK
jgi:hypothetical protein